MSVESNQNTASEKQDTTEEVRRVLAGLQDALTDEMVGRIAGTVSDGLGMLDQLTRSGVDKAIPVLAQMAESGDLQRVAQLVRVVGAVQDAMTEEMIVRVTAMMSQAMTLFERLNRTDLDKLITMLPRMVALFEQLEQHQIFDDLLEGLDNATQQAEAMPPARGGLSGLWAMARQSETQETLRFLLLVSQQFYALRSGR